LLIQPLFADASKDSLINAISTRRGLPRIDARLQYVYELRRSDPEIAEREAVIALEEAQSLKNRDREARTFYYLGMICHYDGRSDSAVIFLQNAESLYREAGDHENLSKVLSLLGTAYLSTTGNQEQAIIYYNESLNEARKVSDHNTMAIVYSQLSNIFRMNGSYQQSIEFIYKAREHYEMVGFTEGIAWINYSIGRIYNTMGLYDEAEKLFLQGLEMYRSLPENYNSLTGKAICMDELGIAYLELGNIQKAREYNAGAAGIYRTQRGGGFGISNSLKYLARIEFVEGNVDESLRQLGKSLRIKKRINDRLGLPGVYLLYGEILSSRGQDTAAIDSLLIGLYHADNNNQKTLMIHLNRQLARIFEAREQFDKAFQYQYQQLAIMDSIYESRATRGMTQLESLYKQQAQEEVIRELEHESVIKDLKLSRELAVQHLLMIILLLVLIFAFFILRLYLVNRKINSALEDQRKKLQELNATKDKFFSIIAHDLKSPFNSIIGFSTLMERYGKAEDFEKMKEFSRHIKSVSTQTFKLLENLLDWARSQTGQIHFNPRELDIEASIQNALDLLSPLAQRKQIGILTEAAPIKLRADENMLHTILQNLISNAIKYSRHGSTIIVAARDLGKNIMIAVRDEGIGMGPDLAEHIFEIGESGSRPGTDKEEGTGLGLIICREFVEKHGGNIRVESEPGKGSNFIVVLPK
jgi:signal transduction histidine kinase